MPAAISEVAPSAGTASCGLAIGDGGCGASEFGWPAWFRPCIFPYTSGLNVLSALAIAGGPTYRASKSTVMIQHPGESGLKEYAMDAAVPILPGDIIKVPQRYF